MDFTKVKTVFLDGDGVLWRAQTPMPGLNEFFDTLEEQGKNWALLTNNNTNSVQTYVEKLTNFGVKTKLEQVFSSITASVDYLLEQYGAGAPIHVVGMEPMVLAIQQAGFKVSTGEVMPDHKVVAVMAGMDRAITHEKIKIAMRLILGGADFIATNIDSSFPTEAGLNPGTGMVIGALHYTTEIAPLVIGKPEKAIYESALKKMKADRESTIMIGDRLTTDILGAQRVGITAVAVLTGVTDRELLTTSEIKPDFVFEDISEITKAMNGL